MLFKLFVLPVVFVVSLVIIFLIVGLISSFSTDLLADVVAVSWLEENAILYGWFIIIVTLGLASYVTFRVNNYYSLKSFVNRQVDQLTNNQIPDSFLNKIFRWFFRILSLLIILFVLLTIFFGREAKLLKKTLDENIQNSIEKEL